MFRFLGISQSFKAKKFRSSRGVYPF